MITEDYVSFETAKLLKQKKFNGVSIITQYDEKEAREYIKGKKAFSSDDPKLKEFYYTIPTLQMAMKWLREIYNIPINVLYERIYIHHYKFTCVTKKHEIGDAHRYDTYEQACEAAIKYCLEKLI